MNRIVVSPSNQCVIVQAGPMSNSNSTFEEHAPSLGGVDTGGWIWKFPLDNVDYVRDLVEHAFGFEDLDFRGQVRSIVNENASLALDDEDDRETLIDAFMRLLPSR